jgi:hypothetical protein
MTVCEQKFKNRCCILVQNTRLIQLVLLAGSLAKGNQLTLTSNFQWSLYFAQLSDVAFTLILFSYSYVRTCCLSLLMECMTVYEQKFKNRCCILVQNTRLIQLVLLAGSLAKGNQLTLTSDFQWSLYFAQLIGSRLKIWQHKRV